MHPVIPRWDDIPFHHHCTSSFSIKFQYLTGFNYSSLATLQKQNLFECCFSSFPSTFTMLSNFLFTHNPFAPTAWGFSSFTLISFASSFLLRFIVLPAKIITRYSPMAKFKSFEGQTPKIWVKDAGKEFYYKIVNRFSFSWLNLVSLPSLCIACFITFKKKLVHVVISA